MLLFIHIHAILTLLPPSWSTFPVVLCKKGRPASQAGPRDDDKEDDNGLGSDEDNTDASPTQYEAVVKVRFEDAMYTHIFTLYILDHAAPIEFFPH